MSKMFLQDSCIYKCTNMYKDLLPLKRCSICPEVAFAQLNKSPAICALANLYPSQLRYL